MANERNPMLSAAEPLISLGEARKLPLLRRSGGRQPDISTLVRWALRGVRGRKLETVLVGGRRYTSAEAVRRFVQYEVAHQQVSPALSNTAARDAAEYLEKEGL